MELSELLKNISIIIGALALISGITAWKREYIGKRKVELAEDTLMLFYQARDAIRDIRNPFGRIGEGSSRKIADNETEAETKLLNQAYVVIERYSKHEDVFNRLQSTRYRFMARFGRENEVHFIELNKVLNEIFMAADMLGTYYWQRQGRVQMGGDEFKKHLDEMYKYEAIFWFMGEEKDEIGPRVEKIINQIEKVTHDILSEKDFWHRNIFGKG
jgi:hypothetical protein